MGHKVLCSIARSLLFCKCVLNAQTFEISSTLTIAQTRYFPSVPVSFWVVGSFLQKLFRGGPRGP